MAFKNPAAMAEALEMTRSGRLADATAIIRATVSGAFAGVSPDPVEQGAGPTCLEPLRALSSHTRSERADVPADAEPGADEHGFLQKSYTSAKKTLHYRLYVPSKVGVGAPLVVMLHGCTQSAEDFARGTGMNALADQHGFIVAYPSQTHAANAQKCWNWFKPSDQQRDRGEPAMIAGLTRQVIAEQHCDEGRVYVAGLSAGGAAAAIMANAYPDIYAAVGVHSGLPCEAARDLPSALMAMRQGGRAGSSAPHPGRFVPVITFHGDRDNTVSEINSRDIVAAASALAGPLTTRSESGQIPRGRRYTREISLNARGQAVIEQWTIHGGGHAWSGGSATGSYTDSLGPDASSEMLRFFFEHRMTG